MPTKATSAMTALALSTGIGVLSACAVPLAEGKEPAQNNSHETFAEMMQRCGVAQSTILNQPTRNFQMGLSSWPYGPTETAVNETYAFIGSHGDIYMEQFDDFVPWDTFIMGQALPAELVEKINRVKNKRPQGLSFVLSLMPLNESRSGLSPDADGEVPEYLTGVNFNNDSIVKGLIDYYAYMIDTLKPDYLIGGQEVNELLDNAGPDAWQQYKMAMSRVMSAIKKRYPDIKYSESATLNKLFNVEYPDKKEYRNQIESYINTLDFIAISYYPFFVGQHTPKDFQQAFDYLHSFARKPIAFVETTHLAEPLTLDTFDLHIDGNACEQLSYLAVLLNNAQAKPYEFIIFWVHRDYDQLWETFPDEVKELGKLWRDTGLLDETGEKRPSYYLWENVRRIRVRSQ